MKVIHTIAEFRHWRRAVAAAHALPFVPTMGALHEGHASLVRQARALAGAAGKVMASIFVNPTQFGPKEDFTQYPRTLESDIKLLREAGCDAVFVPSAEEMYGANQNSEFRIQNSVMVDPGPLAEVLEGAIRPGHFRGVCTVVLKLLNIVEPTHLLLGQKDFQQQAILRRMGADLNLATQVVTCPTLRDPDGLAMSSRNRYLTPDQRTRAVALFEAMTWAKKVYDDGERRPEILEPGMHQRIQARGLDVQYAVLVHPATFAPCRQQIPGPRVILVAAKLGTTRLIDNMLLPALE